MTMIYSSIIYYRISKKIKIVLDNSREEERIKRQLLIRLKLYPLILVVCQTPVSILRIICFYRSFESLKYLSLIASICVIMNGIFNALIYGLTDTVKKALKRLFTDYNSSSSYNNSLMDGLQYN